MASSALNALVAALIRDQETARTESPFYQGGLGVDAILATAPKYNLKPWQAILAGALGGLGSGILKGIGQGSADQKNAAITDKLTKALALTGDARDQAFVDDPMIAKYGPMMKIDTIDQANELAQKKADLEMAARLRGPEIYNEIHGESLLQKARDPITGEVTVIGQGPRDSSQAFGASPANKKLLEALVAGGRLAPDIAAAIKTNADFGYAQRAIGLDDKQDRFITGTTIKAGEDIAKAKPSEHFQEVRANWQAANDLAQQDTQSAAIGMIKAAAKIMNPGAVVRESSFEILSKNPNNYTLQLQDYLSEIKGQGQLSAEHKRQLLNAMKPFAEAAAEEYKTFVDAQLGTVKNAGIDSSKIMTVPADLPGAATAPTSAVPPPFDPTTQRLLQNPTTGAFRVVPR